MAHSTASCSATKPCAACRRRRAEREAEARRGPPLTRAGYLVLAAVLVAGLAALATWPGLGWLVLPVTAAAWLVAAVLVPREGPER